MTRQPRKHLDELIDEMRAVADNPVPRFEEVDADLQQQVTTVDGYDVILDFSQAEYDNCRIEQLEISGANSPFLPMFLVCKLGAKFLGGHELRLSETFRHGKKLYAWTVAVDDRGRPIPLNPKFVQTCSYQDFRFYRLRRGDRY